MFTSKSPAYSNDNRTYQKKKKFLKRYNRIPYPQNNRPTYDLRLIVLRHAERIDISLGSKWYEEIFGNNPSPPRQSYLHPQLPQRLPYRRNGLLYVFDPPLIRAGEQASFVRGRDLAQLGMNVDYCYSSPASRSVLTANAVLKGMSRSRVPICLEPYLFEPMSWNTPLQMLGNISPFMSTREWKHEGYNIDQSYQRLHDYLHPLETETDYFNRSKKFFRSIEQRQGDARAAFRHGRVASRPSTVLIVGHAASPLIFPIIAARQPFNADEFGRNCGHISFLHTTVLERDALSGVWNIRHVTPFV